MFTNNNSISLSSHLQHVKLVMETADELKVQAAHIHGFHISPIIGKQY